MFACPLCAPTKRACLYPEDPDVAAVFPSIAPDPTDMTIPKRAWEAAMSNWRRQLAAFDAQWQREPYRLGQHEVWRMIAD